MSDVAEANDLFRNKLRNDDDHKLVIQDALSASGFYSAAIAAVRTFHKFDAGCVLKDNGRFTMLDRSGFFQIEYFSKDDWAVPGNPLKGEVKRKITIGLGDS
jgi:hypothetical protein